MRLLLTTSTSSTLVSCLSTSPTRGAPSAGLIAALKPGGWLVVEDFDPSFAGRTLPSTDDAGTKLTAKVFAAMRTLMQGRGLDVEFARSLYARFVAMGLTEVGMEGHMGVRPGGSDGALLDIANLNQVRDEAVARGLLNADEVERMTALLETKEFAVFSPMMFSARDRPLIRA